MNLVRLVKITRNPSRIIVVGFWSLIFHVLFFTWKIDARWIGSCVNFFNVVGLVGQYINIATQYLTSIAQNPACSAILQWCAERLCLSKAGIFLYIYPCIVKNVQEEHRL